MTKKMGVQWGCVGYDVVSDVGKRGGSSEMDSSIPKKEDENRWAVLW